MKNSSTISSKGQITVPQELRKRLGLEAGDRVEFVVEEGRTVMRPLHSEANLLTKAETGNYLTQPVKTAIFTVKLASKDEELQYNQQQRPDYRPARDSQTPRVGSWRPRRVCGGGRSHRDASATFGSQPLREVHRNFGPIPRR